MAVTTVYCTSNDGRIESGDASAATAKSGSGLSTSATGYVAYAYDGNYYIEQTFIDFDTSAISGSIVSAVLSLYNPTRGGSYADTAQARLYDYGASLTTADYRTPTQFAALPLLAHLAFSSAGAGYIDFIDDALAANINKGGHTRIVLCTALFAANGTPTVDSYLNGFGMSGDANKSKLTITTSSSSFDARVSRAAYLRM